MVEQDYYDLLGVQRGADDAAIKAAYRRLAKEHHPDRHNGCAEQEARFKAINEAYDVLKDPQKRAAYDRFGKAAFQNGGGGGDPFGDAGFNGFSDIFSTIFGEFMDPRGQRQNAARGADLRFDLELTLEEAFAGAAVERRLAEAVVGGALLRVLEDVIGLADRLEMRFLVGAAIVAVGMAFHRQLAISGLDHPLVGGAGHAQQLVIITLGHANSPPGRSATPAQLE